MSGRVVHFEIPFDDGDRARQFYRDAFGWVINEIPEMRYSLVQTGPITDEGFPAVVVGTRVNHEKSSYVFTQSRDASQEAVEHLIGLGHRRIAVAVNLIDDSDHLDRIDGYRSAELPANRLQAQRDFFGAHTYERVDKPRGQFFHTNWTGHGGDTASTAYNV